KVAAAGTVRVPELMGIHPYRGVWHGVSTVEATLSRRRDPADLLPALFPGGSITGAPKRAAMQLLSRLEGEPRGFYTGSLGFVAPDGRMSFSILIRTLVRDRDGWSVAVGGGIVADSQPEREIAETWEKVAVLRELLRPAPRARPRSHAED
ncbi:MAG TPA: chorismate-binding protein, partial [Myxococcota bacterium]|nr:chorismate-binding protein [Myxococcota bacterium]